MRTGQLLAAACFVVLTAAACGGMGGTTSAGSGAVLSTTTPGSAVTTTTAPTTHPAPPPVTTGPPPAGGRTTVPSGQISAPNMAAQPQGVQAAGNDVVFNAEQSGCQQITAQTIAQTATQVTIQVITTNTSKGNQMCPMIVRVVQVTAALNAPLGNRTIVFQAVSKHS
jgi:hypothetical protein